MFVCNNCGNESIKWIGKCSFCKEFGTMVEFKEQKGDKKSITPSKKELINITNISDGVFKNITTNSNELNNLLGGGITFGSITLLTGEPGIGKSTLALQLSNFIDNRIIYVSGEENENQLLQRAKRLNITSKNLSILCENNLENIFESIMQKEFDVLIIDSISVINSLQVNGVSGSIVQVKEIAERLLEYSKKNNKTTIIIGHVTKDGNIAGPKVLEHLVDIVLFFEGEKFDDIRILRCLKNRFYSTGEIALFKMTEEGLFDIKNPGLEFVSNNNSKNAYGSSLSVTIEGNRPIIVEIECLTTYTKFGYPKRSSRGIASQKLDLILAILSKYTKVNLDSSDVYLNIVRGFKVIEPGIDLSIAASIISSKINKYIPKDMIFIGETSLTGVIKNTFKIEKRIKEVKKLGFKSIIIPNIDLKEEKGVEYIRVNTILDLVNFLTKI